MQELKKINNNIPTDEYIDPLISVITVVFNGEKHLGNTIKSIIPNKNSSVEYIVIDGGSSDNTVKIAEKYNTFIDYFISEPDDGIYDAMNKGASIAKGKYISFLNASDEYFKDTLRIISNKIENHDYDYLVAPVIIASSEGKQIKISYPIKNFIYNFGSYMKMPAPHLSVFMKKEFFFELDGYDLSFSLSSDYDLLLRASAISNNVCYIDNLVGIFSLGGISGSHKTNVDNFRVLQKHGLLFYKNIFIFIYFSITLFLRKILPYKFLTFFKIKSND
jgi:glycosyltransferase involved in cell wall biosynthesis